MTQLEELTNRIIKFREARDWAQFHNPKDIAIALSIEASELLEHFLWTPSDKTRNISAEKEARISEELGDVFYFLLLIGHELKIDLSKALLDKLKVNKEKYPVKLSRGNSKKYTDLK